MHIECDDEGMLIDLSPEEVEDLAINLCGHSEAKPAVLKELRVKLAEFCNGRRSYHERIAGAKQFKARPGR